MPDFSAELIWHRGGQPFVDERYSRRHLVRFDGGVEIPVSSSPEIVPPPLSDATAVDPEEAFIAALASCHLLWYLALAAKRRYCVDRYVDRPIGHMRRDDGGRLAISTVILRPEVRFSGPRRPTREIDVALHHEAHGSCFLANSVKTEIRCEPVWSDD
jgi:organic hydroperoxide reductase OsmC/OhrA